MLWTRLLFVVIAAGVMALPHASAQAQMAGLISSLTEQLNVTPAQAEGGAGAMFGFAKSNLSKQDYSTVQSSLPGVDALIAKAPNVSSSSSSSKSGGSSLLGTAGSLLGSAGKGLTSVDQLGQSFSVLGMSPALIQQFSPIILDYAEQVGGPGVAQILQGTMTLLQ